MSCERNNNNSSSAGGCCCPPEDATGLLETLGTRISGLEAALNALPQPFTPGYTKCGGATLASNAQLVTCDELETMRQAIVNAQQTITDCEGNAVSQVPTCQQVSGLSTSIQTVTQQVNQLSSAMSSFSAQQSSLASQVSSIASSPASGIDAATIAGIQAQITALQDDLDTTNTGLAAATVAVGALEGAAASSSTDTQIADLQDSVDTITTQQGTQDSNITTLQSDLATLTARVTALEAHHP